MKKWALRIGLGTAITLGVLIVGTVGYVEATAPGNLQFPETPSPAIHASTDPAVIERGRQLARGVAHCAACHGDYDVEDQSALREDVPLSGGIAIRPPFGVFYAANITPDRETGIGDWSDAEIARVIRTGVRRNGELSLFMKLAVGPTSDEDLTAIVSYLRSLAPVRHEVPESEENLMARALVTFSPIPPDPSEAEIDAVPPGDSPSVERGRYLAEGPGLCAGCHTPPSDGDMFAPDRARLFAGGQPMEGHDPSEGEIEYAPPNLTPDAETGYVGRWSEDQMIERFMVTGRTGSGSPMPWECFARMSESDLRSIYRYIQSVPAVHRNTGPPSRPAGSFTAE